MTGVLRQAEVYCSFTKPKLPLLTTCFVLAVICLRTHAWTTSCLGKCCLVRLKTEMPSMSLIRMGGPMIISMRYGR